VKAPELNYQHLIRLTDQVGLFEHARLAEPRRAEGYTTDDVARALIVTSREHSANRGLERISSVYLDFIEKAIRPDGRLHNRMDVSGAWVDEIGSGDCHGRALWALGATVRWSADSGLRHKARRLWDAVARVEGPFLRPHACFVLGACDLMATDPAAVKADHIRSAIAPLLRSVNGSGRWPEGRLTYANGRLPAALIAAGEALADETILRRGLSWLEWLVEVETAGDHFSFVPAGGWTAGEPRPGFDQQPIEAWAMADACWQAFQATGDPLWAGLLVQAGEWFLGRNDAGLELYDPETGAGYDGLEREGVNRNQGAESTISALATIQLWREVEETQAVSAATSSRSSTTAAPTARSAAP